MSRTFIYVVAISTNGICTLAIQLMPANPFIVWIASLAIPLSCYALGLWVSRKIMQGVIKDEFQKFKDNL